MSVLITPGARRWLVGVVLLLSVVAVDQATKLAAAKAFLQWEESGDPTRFTASQKRLGTWQLGQEVRLYAGLSYVRNFSAAFDGKSSLGEPTDLAWLIVAAAVLFLAVAYLYILSCKRSGECLGLNGIGFQMLLGGILGNLLDRCMRGYVIDWIDLRWLSAAAGSHATNVNVADAAMAAGLFCLGASLIGSDLRRLRRRVPTAQNT